MRKGVLKEENIFIKEKKDNISRSCTIQLCSGDNILASAEIRTAGDTWVFQKISVAEEHRAKGYGSEVLKKLVGYLDRNQIDLYAYIHSSGSLSEQQLAAWYKRHGFVDSDERGYQLVRKSRQNLVVNEQL